MFFLKKIIALLIIPLTISACSFVIDKEQDFEKVGSDKKPRRNLEKLGDPNDTLFGGPITLGGPTTRKGEETTGIGVNIYLWRATLEALSVGPLESTDPFAGVVSTDWFTLDDAPTEQIKITAFIAGRSLRPDNIKIAIYLRDSRERASSPLRGSKVAENKVKDAILSRARVIRVTEYR